MFSGKDISVDADGTFSVDIRNWGQHRAGEIDTGEFHIVLYGMVDGAVRHAEASVRLKVGEQASGIVLDLRAEDYYPLRIRVVDPAGKLIRNARVSLFFRYPDGDGHSFFETYDGKEMGGFMTDAENLAPELHLLGYEYQFGTIAEGFKKLTWRKGPSMKIPEEIPEDGILQIQLEPGGRIAGRVVDSEGAPVADAKLAMSFGRTINLPWTAIDDVFTDVQGQFAFTTLEPVGKYTLQAYHQQHGVDCILDVPVGTDGIVLRLMPLVSLCGTIVKDSSPVAIPKLDLCNAIGNRLAIGLVKSRGAYAKFNDNRVHPYASYNYNIRSIGITTDESGVSRVEHLFPIATDESGVFRVDHLFPYATYELTILYEGKEYSYKVTLGADPVTSRTFETT